MCPAPFFYTEGYPRAKRLRFHTRRGQPPGIETADIGDRYDSQIREEGIRDTILIDYQAIDSSRRVCTHDESCRSDDEKLRRPRHEIVK